MAPFGSVIQSPDQWFSALPQSRAARLLACGFDVNQALRTLDLLRKDEWERLDEVLVRVAREQLNGIADLRNAGLTLNLGGLGVILSQYETVSEFIEATQSLDVITPPEEDTAEFNLISVPVPITHSGFRVSLRHLQASRTIGAPIDTTNVELATRQVTEKLEDMLFNGSSIVVGANQIFGYTTHPDRNTGTLAATWTDTVNREIIQDVISMISLAEGDSFFGPFMLYVPQLFFSELIEDYKADSERTFLERIMAIPQISGVKVTAKLANNEVVLVQMTRDVVDLAIGQDITTVEWQSMGGLLERFIVMAALVPRIKSDAELKSGVVHFTV